MLRTSHERDDSGADSSRTCTGENRAPGEGGAGWRRRELADGLELKVDGEEVYAWDVWLVYGPDAVWEGELPPKPEYFMHQLWALGGTDLPRFDSEVFAQRVHQLLATAHP